MNSVFSEQILADKLSKLSNTQQCIETLSHWCIFHRQKAEQVVQTWDKQFRSSAKEHKIPFLYLANDILQNSRRKGTEFVAEFWKVLPAAIKDVFQNGDDRGKNVVSRLVGIWEERKVFGSHAHGLKDLMLGEESVPALELNKKRPRSSVRIMRRDSRSVKIKLSVGGTVEKIVSAFHSVLSEHPAEDVDLKKAKDAVHRLGNMEKDVDSACSQAENPQSTVLASKIQEDENLLKQCIEKLKSIETNRAALVSQLKEALREQESGLENVRTQLQVAQAQIEEAANMKRRLNNEPVTPPTNPSPVTPSQTQNTTTKKSTAAIAAEVADKFVASTHSRKIITSVFSSFVAEEAKNAGLSRPSTPANSVSGGPTQDTRLKLEKSMGFSENGFIASQPAAVTTAQQYQAVLISQPSIQPQPSTSQQYTLFPAQARHYIQQGGGQLMIGVPYAYNNLPTPQRPLPPAPQLMNMARAPQMLQQQAVGLIQQPQLQMPMNLQQPIPINQQPLSLNMQQPVPPNYRPLQPPGMTFYHHQSQKHDN